MGRRAFETARHAGAQLDLDATIDYVLESQPRPAPRGARALRHAHRPGAGESTSSPKG